MGTRIAQEQLSEREQLSLLLQAVIVRLERLTAAVIEPPRRGIGAEEGIIRRVRVATAGTPVQGPRIAITPGYDTTVRQRRNPGTPNGYVAYSSVAVKDTTQRIEIQDNDAVSLRVSNWDRLWFDADTDDTDFELFVEA